VNVREIVIFRSELVLTSSHQNVSLRVTESMI